MTGHLQPVDEHHLHGTGSSPECALCPVCVMLQAVTASRPEVTGHLLAAGRELSLALAAAFAATAESFDRAATVHEQREEPPEAGKPAAPPRLRRISVE